MEQFRTPLEEQRFHISPESFEHMHALERCLKAVQMEYPQFKALTFFGSRIVGKERPDSDIDAFIFVDTVAFKDRAELEKAEQRAQDIIRDEWRRTFGTEKENKHYHIQPVFCSEEYVDYQTGYFVGQGDVPPKDLELSEVGRTIAAPFLLGVGDIYPIRQQILERFEHEENKEQLYKKLLTYIQYLERSDSRQQEGESPKAPQYEKFPETFDEGKNYFLNEISR